MSRSAGSRLKVLVCGMLAGVPGQAGATWAVLQYLLGLRRLGHDVRFVEPVPVSGEDSRLDPACIDYFQQVVAEFGFEDCALLLARTSRGIVEQDSLRRLARDCDLFINISGLLPLDDVVSRIPVRLYLDLDPAFTQLWAEVEGIDMHFEGHTHFATVGEAIGSDSCGLPDCGLTWFITRPPVVLEEWPFAQRPHIYGLTTVANWRAYGSVQFEGRLYGQKAHSLRLFCDLPRRVEAAFQLALAIHPDETKDRAALTCNRWQLLDPARVAATPATYKRFIQLSRAEFAIAKSGYVLSRCGWFSDRSACYLAAGRPVVAQETGFSRFIPTGDGLLSFEDSDGALAAIDRLERDYESQRLAARSLAEAFFDSDKVLARLLAGVGLA